MPPRSRPSSDALYPTTPQKAAGRMTEPPVWVPLASGAMKAATAAAEPLEETPGDRSVPCGLRTPTGTGLANSVVVVLPSMTAPALRSAATQFESAAGRCPL